MKKLYLMLKSFVSMMCFVVALMMVFVGNVFAEVAEAAGASTNIFVTWFYKYGGWQVVIACFLIIWIIRATKTKKDDEILDKYVKKGVEYALAVMPKDSKIDWVKFVANALGKFNEIYTKTEELPPDAKLYEKAKQLIEELAKLKQLEQTKVA
jgi:hypothetical protein